MVMILPYKNPEKQKEAQHNHYLNNKSEYVNRSKIWKEKNRTKVREYGRNLRKQVIELLGGKCIYCGCEAPEALEINHKNGGGYNEKYYKKYRTSFYLDILKGRRTKDDLELTCRVCNAVHYLEKLKNLGKHWTVIYHN